MTQEILRQKLLEKGETLWLKFNGNAPPASGEEEKDKPRLQMFKGYISGLKRERREALEVWLCQRTGALERNLCELTSSTIEDWETKLKKIYAEHLKMFSTKTI